MSEQTMQTAKKRREAKTEKDKYVRKELNVRELLEKKQYNTTCKDIEDENRHEKMRKVSERSLNLELSSINSIKLIRYNEQVAAD